MSSNLLSAQKNNTVNLIHIFSFNMAIKQCPCPHQVIDCLTATSVSKPTIAIHRLTGFFQQLINSILSHPERQTISGSSESRGTSHQCFGTYCSSKLAIHNTGLFTQAKEWYEYATHCLVTQQLVNDDRKVNTWSKICFT